MTATEVGRLSEEISGTDRLVDVTAMSDVERSADPSDDTDVGKSTEVNDGEVIGRLIEGIDDSEIGRSIEVRVGIDVRSTDVIDGTETVNDIDLGGDMRPVADIEVSGMRSDDESVLVAESKEFPRPARVPVRPALPVAPAATPTVPEPLRSIPPGPVLTITSTVAVTDSDRLAAREFCRFRMVLLEASVNPTLRLASVPIPVATSPPTQPFKMFPPLEHVGDGDVVMSVRPVS